jgi:hypothetical protein
LQQVDQVRDEAVVYRANAGESVAVLFGHSSGQVDVPTRMGLNRALHLPKPVLSLSKEALHLQFSPTCALLNH